MSAEIQDYFSYVMNPGGFKVVEDKNKFIKFDVYYCCALVGLAACKKDDNKSDLSDIMPTYPKEYRNTKAYIAGLLVASEAKKNGINIHNPKLEEIMLTYLSSDDDTMLSDLGVETLNAYSLKGARILQEHMLDRPSSKEEFLQFFYSMMKSFDE
jgi:hypothetical protein